MYFDVQALQISLLGGRIFFKGLRYHGNNETILVHSGFVTWVYWLRNARELDLAEGRDVNRMSKQSTRDEKNETTDPAAAEKGGQSRKATLPCRLTVELKGLEWFIYNRSPAYDSIVAGLTKESPAWDESVPVDETAVKEEDLGLRRRSLGSQFGNQLNLARTVTANFSESDNNEGLSPLAEKDTYQTSRSPDSSSSIDESADQRQIQNEIEQSFILRFLPVHIQCTKAAVVLGNENTKSVFITKADRFSGEIDATASRAPDLYKLFFNFQLEHPVVQMKPNDDYKEDQTATASRAKDDIKERIRPDAIYHHRFFHRYRRKAWHKLQNLVPYFSSSVETFSTFSTPEQHAEPMVQDHSNHWQGLSRYLNDDEADGKAKWSTFEYATVSTILDSPQASISYYWDIPGKVQQASAFSKVNSWQNTDINGDRPPEWGIDVVVKGAMVNYGPWADRQRADLQRVFFPSLCKDAFPAKKLKPGDTRVATTLKIYIQLDDDTTLRVPIREESKNWKWKVHADTMTSGPKTQKPHGKGSRKHKSKPSHTGPEIRPFGWLDLKMSTNATVNYTMDMVAGTSGFSNKLDLDLPNLEIITSVNHGLLWRSLNQRFSCDLSNPLGWNSLHTWKFDFVSNGMELFLLREHIFLLIDLIDDWTSGLPSDYLTFVPFQYLLNLQFGNFRLYLNVNDSNIINNPSDMDDNTFLIIFGTALAADLCIPLDRYRPHRNDVSFDVKAHTSGLSLHVPPWNTQATFLKSNKLAQLEGLAINGKYQYCDTTSPSNTDTVLLNISGRNLEIQLYGFLIRYFMKIKDNYFGEDIHFRTLEEYQQTINPSDPTAAALLGTPPHKKTNDLDVILSINAENSSALLPANLYSANRHVKIEIATLSADLRFTNYYMDLNLSLSPLAFSLGKLESLPTPTTSTSGTQLYVDAVEIFGNRLFGLPPTEPTYLCNWDFTVGAITGETSADFVMELAAGLETFAFSFDDDENALAAVAPLILHDVTFLRASVGRIHIWIHVHDAAFLASTGPINVNFNDWAGMLYSKKLKVSIPDLVLACVDADSASRHRSRIDHPVETHAYVTTTLELTMVARKAGFEQDRNLQQNHVRREDSRTHRTPFLLLDDPFGYSSEHVDLPAMWVPPVPAPIDVIQSDAFQDNTSNSKSSIGSSRRDLRRKSSFLSTSSSGRSSQKSIIRTHSSPSASKLQHGNSPESPSRSSQLGSNLHRTRQTRDVSTSSTGRQSSFYSAADHNDRRSGDSSSVVFSSPFMPPYFPLDNVDPDTKNVPQVSLNDLDEVSIPEVDLSLIQKRFDNNAEYTSFIVELKQGIRAYCTPEALKAAADLIVAMQPTRPEDILDSLQMESMNSIFAANKERVVSGKNTDLNVVIPVIRLRFGNSLPSESHSRADQPLDQYDFTVCGLSVIARQGLAAKRDADSAEPAHTSTIHVRLQTAEISAKERFHELDNAQAAINGRIEDIIFWMASSDTVSGSLNLEVIDIALASSKVEYLASLLHRTTRLASEKTETFAGLARHQKDRVRVFVFLLATTGHHTTDPLFLTRPSYVLRSATGHLRTTDSWKAITRLRHVYSSLSWEEQRKMVMRLTDNCLKRPEDIRQQVQAGLEQWRSWDLENLTECVLMTKVFGSLIGVENAPYKAKKPLRLALVARRLNLVLDPGPKQNEIAITALAANTSMNTPNALNDSNAVGTPHIPCTILQIYCEDASLNLNWELCELAENISRLYNESQTAPAITPIIPAATLLKPKAPKAEYHIHVIMVAENGSVSLETINIRTVSLCKGLKASIVMAEGQPDDRSMVTTLFTAEAATTRTQSHQQELSIYQIRRPTVNISCETQLSGSIKENAWKIAGNAQQISFVVKQEPIALLEVLDCVVGDEAAQIRRIFQSLPKKSAQQPVKPNSPDITVINKINIILFLDVYHISLPLLHSLRYDISGVVARASLAARQIGDFVFDFDIKENSHDIQTQSAGKSRKISVLQLPPTNGRLIAQITEDENKVSVFVSVEPIFLDAAAIQSVFSALNKPEISSVVDEMRESMQNFKTHVQDVFHPEEMPTKLEAPGVEVSKPFIYDAHLSLAGLEVFTDAPNGHDVDGKVGKVGKARLTFNLGYVQVEASNRLEAHGPVLEYPELQLSLRQVVFDLSSMTDIGEETTCGNFAFAAYFTVGSKKTDNGDLVRSYHLTSDTFEINLFADTASTIVNVLGHLQNKIRELDLAREVQYLQRLRKPRITVQDEDLATPENAAPSTNLFDSMFSLELSNIQLSWIAMSPAFEEYENKENLVLSLQRISLSTKKKNSARLAIENLMLQMVPPNYIKKVRSQNSALLPEIIFNVGFVSTTNTTRLAFQAAGKSLDLRLTSQFIIPGSYIQKSIESAAAKVRTASASWVASSPASEKPSDTTKNMFFGKKRMESLLVDADFAGAIVHLQGMKPSDVPIATTSERRGRVPQVGRYGQFSQEDASNSTMLRAPGLAIKVEYKDNGVDDPSLNAEVKVDASENILYPQVVPLILEISSNVKAVMRSDDEPDNTLLQKVSSGKLMAAADENILTADPSAVLGRTRLNLGIRICAQEFTLSCQPIARVSATAKFDDIYTTMNTVRSVDHGHFFAISASIRRLRTSVQHVYSRESTGSFEVNSIVLSLMNSKHVSGISGLSAILKIDPMKVIINGKQLQDFLLFRDIWIPSDLQQTSPPVKQPTSTAQSQAYLVQRYQQVAATGAFPWNATIAIEELDVQLELGQAIGKSKFIISKFWVSAKKSSDWEQNLCLGFEKVGIDSTGRMSGFASLQDFRIRTSIQWPEREKAINQTPLVQGAISFSQFRLKAAFDYQAFLVADITSFQFLLYNVRNGRHVKGDRLVSMLDGDSVQIFCTTTTASQALALYQAFEKLVQEKRTNYQASLREVERFMKRKPSSVSASQAIDVPVTAEEEQLVKSPITLHTNLIVTLRAVNMGAYPSTFFDPLIFKLEALNAEFRFTVAVTEGRVHSQLGVTLGQLRIGLAGVKAPEHPRSSGEISVEEVVSNANGSRGGTILKVPKVEATMETWQSPSSNRIDYIFKSSFEGKVEVGWNYSRISYIRGMYGNHAKSLAQRLGKPLPPSAVKITGVPEAAEDGKERKAGEQQKITAEVTVPQSKYEYHALEPPIIETPQLRDMGEATPPLEWIGLHRDRLPNLTHQIVIVTLLELASEVEDAYAKILGSS